MRKMLSLSRDFRQRVYLALTKPESDSTRDIKLKGGDIRGI
jgi:hypothetical protein